MKSSEAIEYLRDAVVGDTVRVERKIAKEFLKNNQAITCGGAGKVTSLESFEEFKE